LAPGLDDDRMLLSIVKHGPLVKDGWLEEVGGNMNAITES